MTWNTHIPKFRRFVLQNFPFIEEDFDALTDYALICKVIEYLNTVITSQNELVAEVERFEGDVNDEIDTFETNITADFTRLEGLFNDLKSFVDNYFDNLDVQEEINNKLEEMADDGTLQEIITTYIQSNVAWTFDTVAEMKAATNLVDGSFAQTLGYYARNDGGASMYKIRSKTDSDTTDEMLLVAIGDNLVAELVLDTTINSKQCGIKGDGTTDETVKLNTFFALSTDYNKVINKGIYVTSGTIFIKGRWSDQEAPSQKIRFDQATIKYTGTANNASIIIFDMKHGEIDGLNIATNSNENYVQITGCWFDIFKNWVIRNLKISNDSTEISSMNPSTLSCAYLYFINVRLWNSSNLSIDTASGSYINSIFFNNTAIESRNKQYCVIFNGAGSHQNIVFTDSDLSYATTAIFSITDSLTGNGNVKLENCYLDSSIPLFTNRNNLIINTSNCFSGANTSKLLPLNYVDRVSSKFDNSYFYQGNNDIGENVNYSINGDMSSSNEGTSGGELMQASNAFWTKSYITSILNANNRARKVTLTSHTSGNASVTVKGIAAPRAGTYTAYARIKVNQANFDSLQMAFNGIYPTWTKAEIGDGEVLLSAQKQVTVNTALSFSLIFIKALQDLDFEVYEVGVVMGDKYQPYAKLHESAKI